LAVGENGLILSSENGQNWTRSASNTGVWLNDAAFVEGTWFAFGSEGTVLTSTDAIRWNLEKTPTSRSLYGAATHEDQLVVVGLEGVILRKRLKPSSSSLEILDFRRQNSALAFLLAGTLDQHVTLESADALGGPWFEVDSLEFINPSGTLIYEASDGNRTKAFYRLKSP
jgi:photosystem II stability/assembly factor-like uncharacterized protein